MCGIAAVAGWRGEGGRLEAMLEAMNERQRHRGPDDAGIWLDEDGFVGLGHRRLSILDLSAAGRQPMASADGRLVITYNGEVYNYLELRQELEGYPFRTGTDTEVVLAAWERWGEKACERFIGMFAFVIWDRRERTLWAVRDRFGVKPLYWSRSGPGELMLASEVKALHSGGVEAHADEGQWATWLATGLSDYSERTFWRGVHALPAGALLRWSGGDPEVRRWYDLAERAGEEDPRSEQVVIEEYRALLEESVRLRFRSDVAVGINLSGGLDSSTLLSAVHAAQGRDSAVKVFTFTTGDPGYDELPWVQRMIERTRHPLHECRLAPQEASRMAERVMEAADGPYGGLPTLAYSRLFERARSEGVVVLLDGQGLDEQWAGYDYYETALRGGTAAMVQGGGRAVRPECLAPEFAALAAQPQIPRPFGEPLRDLQYRDACLTKIPRALRYNDRISMMSGCELREPFLDHRLFELALRQPAGRKIRNGTRKALLREIASTMLPEEVALAPKRPLQTPQREWLRGPLREWAEGMIHEALQTGWFAAPVLRREWEAFLSGASDSSFYVWQWISAGLARRAAAGAREGRT